MKISELKDIIIKEFGEEEWQFFKEKIMVLFILLVYLILYAVYLPYKLKGLVDERA